MASTHFKTAGMACEACSALVEMNLERLQGVIAAHANLDTGMTTVLYDPREVDELEIADEIDRSGFRARLISYPRFVSHGDIRAWTLTVLGPPPPSPELPSDEDEPLAAATAEHGLRAVHIRTSGLRCPECTALVEETVSHLGGVMDVTAVKSLGLTSILFDEGQVDSETIAATIRQVGFGAEVVRSETGSGAASQTPGAQATSRPRP